ncbi:hypothetical protein CKCBHOJB_01717 [Thauera sp. GDN1]|uniref:hypothetical protein n=1 Tax=Thauera sp. GDN1 TaxID=2944810 RepID=UPI00247A6055|nr:hypothetical protein [Thauera sp. GDN1]WEN42132.1 hypothetical protein CKCBHOJB_01717 [Thauera sp. GDN1]
MRSMLTADMIRYLKTPAALAALIFIMASSVPVSALSQSSPPAKAAKRATQPIPAAGELTAIVRTTLRKLNRNNKTNHYEELHEHLTPQMQLSVTPQKLSEAFSGFRRNGLDMSGVAQIEPQFLRQPTINEEGTLLLNGVFPMQPRVVHFNLGYRRVDGVWMLQAFQIDTPTQGEWQAALDRQRRAAGGGNGNNGGALGDAGAAALDRSTDPPTALRW